MMFQPSWALLIASVALLAATLVWTARHWTSQAAPGRALAGVRLLVAAAVVVITAHPTGTVQVAVPRETTTDLLLVIDRTASMGALDHDGTQSRMDGVSADLSALVERLGGAQVAVVVFDDDARLAVPFTTDVTATTSYLRNVGWRPSTRASGSDISVAAELAGTVLDQAAAARPTHDRYVVYVGDGEQTAESEPASFDALADKVSGALVLGYGTSAGGPMPVMQGSKDLITIGGDVQRSRLDAAALRTIARQLGGSYEHRTGPGPLPELVPPASVRNATELRPGREVYWIIALAVGAGLLVLLWTSVAGLRAAREEVTHAP
jgi:Ca-activated chloride channel homolog